MGASQHPSRLLAMAASSALATAAVLVELLRPPKLPSTQKTLPEARVRSVLQLPLPLQLLRVQAQPRASDNANSARVERRQRLVLVLAVLVLVLVQ